MTLLHAATAGARTRLCALFAVQGRGGDPRSTSGAVYVGCNVENVAYPEGTCAEAGAIAAMIAAGDTRIAEVCVIADSPDPVPPCGGCRQKIAEFAAQDVQVTLCTTDGKRAGDDGGRSAARRLHRRPYGPDVTDARADHRQAARRAGSLRAEELRLVCAGLASGAVTDAQAGAFAMAVLLKGLGEAGRVALTRAHAG